MSIMLSCVICVCLKGVECCWDSVWVSQVAECGFLWGWLVSVGQVAC